MNRSYSNYWWIYLIRGVFAILFGLTTLVLQATGYATLVVLFGTFMIADGLFSILFSLNARKPVRGKPWLIFVGVIGIVAGILMLLNPFISAITLVCLFALWSFFAGIVEMLRAMSTRGKKRKEGWYVISGILSIIVVILLFTDPLSGSVNLKLIFAVYALVIGASLISLSFKLRRQVGLYREKAIERKRNIIPDPSV